MLQIHGPDDCLTAKDISARWNETFAVLEFGPVHFYIDDPEQCDWLIKAAVEAKRLLLAKRTPADWCPAYTGPDEELDVAVYCDRQAGHPGNHHGASRDGGEVAWPSGSAAAVVDDEPEDHPDTAGPTYGEAELRRAGAIRDEAVTEFTGTVVEFTSDSRLTVTAPCLKPEEHGAGLLGGTPKMPVLCDRTAHHEAAAVTG
jgi:hypothetical protein